MYVGPPTDRDSRSANACLAFSVIEANVTAGSYGGKSSYYHGERVRMHARNDQQGLL